LPITKYVTAVTSNWQDVHNIPLSDFGNLITTGSLSGGTTTTNCDQLVFEFNGSLNAPYTGTVYIDDVKFIASQDIDASTVQTIDSMDDSPNSLSPWQRYGDYTDALTSVPGASGVLGDNAICFTYAYIPGDPSNNYGWAALQRYLKPDFAQANSFSFQYMGAGGPDDVELNVIDMNGVSYCRKFYGASNTGGQWVTATTPINQLSLLVSSATANGPLTKLDLRNISRVELGVSRGLASSGSGGIAFKDIEYASDPAQSATGSSVLDSLEIPDNPFSPNGDGVKDKGRFIFKLKQNARVKLEIYALKGERVRLMDQGEITDGNVHVIEWDGSDDNGVRVNNGLYLYRFYADNMFGQTDKAINVIGVIR
jgi:hypothetical protein